VPIAFSQGFTPHPKISYASAAPTGVASEAEYLEIGLQAVVDPAGVRDALDRALSPGLDVLDVIDAGTGDSLADRIDASAWRIELPEVPFERLAAAVTAFVAADEVLVERLTKQGRRQFDARGAVVWITAGPDRAALFQAPGSSAANGPPAIDGAPGATVAAPCAILDLVVRQVIPSVRPDDVLVGLRVVADLEPPVPPRVIRLAQGRLTAQGEIVDPFVTDDEPINDGALVGGTSE
jgi:hypothetical protein